MGQINYTLGVTSPVVVDPRVKRAQKILNGGNVLGVDYLRGPVDGQFGEATGRACIRAKYLLGYPDKELAPTYGPHLDDFLHGLQLPTTVMMNVAARRERKAAKTPLRKKALAEFLTHVGLKESPPGSNRQMFGVWYGMNGVPWCAITVTYCYVKAGSKSFVKGSRYSYVPYIVADARAGRNGLQVTKDPRPGDVVTFNWDGGVADHVGLFQHWLPGAEGSEFLSVEANTSVGNDSNGGEVMERHRTIGTVECFVRVGR